ncbi:hypothetical protein MtrunA17_Chr7g0229801 [Medicago truncatula]|uniref:Uncharacterized protein n=2 Tax=Medicago truncatula TaxID=3880 RepID=A0A396GW46_MEDTR|nr:hypothetical protein MtrunA17_Chr7g0229801 [Medicago truncatula]
MSQGANLINKQIFGAVRKHNIVVSVPKQVVVPVDSLVNNNEWVTLDNFDEERPIKEGGNVEVAEISAIQKRGDTSTLPICNYFAPLHEDCERPSGEEKLDENDTNKLCVNTLLESVEIMDRVSKEMVCLNPVSQSKVSDVVENVSIESAILNTKHTMTVDKTLISNEPCNKTSTLPLTHFNTESGTNFDMPSAILEKVPDVITVYEEMLRPDKGKISAPSTVTNTAAACRTDEKILTKFWADALETVSDSTLDTDNNTDKYQECFPELNVEAQYLLQHSDSIKKAKRGRPKKTKSPKVPTGTKFKNKRFSEPVVDDGSDIVLTRSKTHTSTNISQ